MSIYSKKTILGCGTLPVNQGRYIGNYGVQMGDLRPKISDMLRMGIGFILGKEKVLQSRQITLEKLWGRRIGFPLLKIGIETAFFKKELVKEIRIHALQTGDLNKRKIDEKKLRALTKGSLLQRFDFLVEIGFIVKTEMPVGREEAPPEYPKEEHPVYGEEPFPGMQLSMLYLLERN